MRRTRLGLLLLAVGWTCFAIALALRTLAPALLGVVLLALASGTPLSPPALQVRRVLPPRAAEGSPATVVTEVDGPESVPLFVEDDLPHGATVLARVREPRRGSGRETTTLRPTRPGILSWERVRVRYQDVQGLLEDEVDVPVLDHLAVFPKLDHAPRPGRMSQQLSDGGKLRRLLATDTEPEFERLREWREGDRLRDVDWAHTALLDRLITREMSPAPVLPIVVMLHAGESMRRERRHNKLATAVHATLGLAGAARAARLPFGLLAWSENGVEAVVPAAAGRRVLPHALLRLAELPASRPRVEVAPAASGVELTPRPEERRFLDAASAFFPGGHGAATPIESALCAVARVCAQPSLVYVFADFEESPGLAATIARRLKARGHEPVLVALASGAHHYALRDVDAEAERELLAWYANREEARAASQRLRVSFLTLGPHLDARTIEEVVRSSS